MTEIALRSITNSGIWIPMLAPTCFSMISSDEPRCRGFDQTLYAIPFVNRYVTCPRLDRRYPNTLFNLVTGKSLYSYRNAWSRDQTLGHFELIMMMHYRVGLEIPLRHTEWQIPVSIRVNPTDTFGDTCNAPLLSPSYVVTFGTPKALLRYPGVTRSHGLRKRYLTLEKL